MRSLIAIIAFAGKEIRLVVRQPKLMGALVLGPFLILGLFAVGFQPNPPALRTVLVLPEESGLAAQAGDIEEGLGGEVDVVATISDIGAAEEQLREGEADIIVVAPSHAAETIRGGEKAVVEVRHDRLDPFDRALISVSAQAAVDELNRLVLGEVVTVTQDQAGDLASALPQARQDAADLTEALRSGDDASASFARSRTLRSLDVVVAGYGPSGELLDGVDRSMGTAGGDTTGRVFDTRALAEQIEVARPDALAQSEQLQTDLEELEAALGEFRAIPPEVLVQPFIAETVTVVTTDVPLTSYYSPAVVLVLLQHVVLTFAAMSIVRERELGTTELFRVGPVRTWELLVGKYLGYSFLGAIVATVLTVAVIFALGTPMAGSWVWLTVVIALTMAASLGLGFLIAAEATSDAQAVQYSMLALLFTIFFGGLVVSLSRLAPGVRELAFIVPATPGTVALQDVMFRAQPPRAYLLVILAFYAVGTVALASWRLERRQVA
ncbi:hypothetical protein BH23ACT5_BH23ACT5_06420 [soil metagenome]